MSGDGLKLDLCAIDNGRFEDVIHALRVEPICGECDYFNPTIQDIGKRYRCHTTPGCISATLHPHLQSYLWKKLGWISEPEHLENLGIRNQEERPKIRITTGDGPFDSSETDYDYKGRP